jgi:hypothetical protein
MTQFDHYFSQAEGYLRDAVTGFFENGGSLCYVIPLANNTLDALQQGLETSEVIENIDLVCVPDVMLASDDEAMRMQQAVLEHCDRLGDRFATLDTFNLADLEKLNTQKQTLASLNGALYTPWLKIEHRSDFIPPCGHIAGIYASCDRTVGVHGAPANIALEGVSCYSFISIARKLCCKRSSLQKSQFKCVSAY